MSCVDMAHRSMFYFKDLPLISMLHSLHKIFAKAKKAQWAVPAFNVSTAEQVRVVVETAVRLKAPIIIATSEGEASLLTYPVAVGLVRTWKECYPKHPIFLNADHHHRLSSVQQAIAAGYDMVHIDASTLSDNANMKLTKQVVSLAHRAGIFVEGEIGNIGGGSERHITRAVVSIAQMTTIEQAANFARTTGVDVLAANVGNIHGLYRGGKPRVAIDRVQAISQATKTFLTLHGGSGIVAKDIREAICCGITKINVNTELRVAFVGELRRVLKSQAEETTPYKLYPVPMESMAKVVATKIKLFGAAGRAGR